MSALTPLSLEDYDAIASAVMETERGRWFLAEFARRNRAADTAAVLDALATLETRLASRQSAPQGSAEAVGRIRAAASLAAGIREALAAVPKPRRQAGRALRQCGELERAIALALEALREGPRALDPPQIAAPQAAEAAEDHDDLEGPAFAAARADPTNLDGSIEEPAAGPVEPSEADADGASWENEDSFPRAVILMNGEAFDLTDDRDGPARPPPASPAPSGRPVMPKAWMPGLLESLTEEEKAILFA
jgi:hypothetical protein